MEWWDHQRPCFSPVFPSIICVRLTCLLSCFVFKERRGLMLHTLMGAQDWGQASVHNSIQEASANYQQMSEFIILLSYASNHWCGAFWHTVFNLTKIILWTILRDNGNTTCRCEFRSNGWPQCQASIIPNSPRYSDFDAFASCRVVLYPVELAVGLLW